MASRKVNVRDLESLLDLVSYGRRGPGRSDRLSPAQVEQVARTVRRVPEVMVKVSGGGTSAKAVAAHFKYIGRHGELEIETDDGDQLKGKGVERSLAEDWGLDLDAVESLSPYTGKPGRKATKLVHNVILSMPAGTPPDRLLAASRAFGREQFALKHRYAMVLHTDQDHPHVHLVVKTMSEQGERLNIRKATLREWRAEFARHLREQGVAANATERAVRGENRTHKIDGIYRAAHRGTSTHVRKRVDGIAAELMQGKLQVEPGKAKLIETRKYVDRGWRAISDILARAGHAELGARTKRFVEEMKPPQTEKEMIAAELVGRTHEPRVREHSHFR